MTDIKTPASHLNDPETSYIAESNINKSGKRFSNQKLITDFVKRHPGLTAAEIGHLTGLGQHECSRRLSELTNVTVRRGNKFLCSIKGTLMMVWHPLYLTEQRELI